MFNQALRRIMLDLIVESTRQSNRSSRTALTEAFWDLQYLYQSGLCDVSDPGLLSTPAPETASTADRVQAHEAVLFELMSAVAGNRGAAPSVIAGASVLTDSAARMASAQRFSQRLIVAAAWLDQELAGLRGGGVSLPLENRYERIPFVINGINVAATSQGTNLDVEKVNIASREALGLWTAATPVDFRQPFAGEEPLLRINFVKDGRGSIELGTTSGFISRTPTGPVGGATITIDCDNDLFVDRFHEPVRHPTGNGPFDFISVLAHEVGHALGLDHPPIDPATGRETEPAMMSANKGNAVTRQLFPFDIREVQRRHGTLRLAQPASANLAESGQLVETSPGVMLQKGTFGHVIAGPMETRATLEVTMPARGRQANALLLTFTTITRNVFVNRASAFEGAKSLQSFAISARNSGQEGLAGKTFDLRLGFMDRPQLGGDLTVRMDLEFTKKDGQPQSDFGVVQLTRVGLETLPPPLVVGNAGNVA